MFKQEVKEAAEVKFKLAAELSKQADTKAENIAKHLKSYYSDKRLDLVKRHSRFLLINFRSAKSKMVTTGLILHAAERNSWILYILKAELL